MTDELCSEISEIASNSSESRVAFFCGRKNFFMGKWIRHAYPPSLIMRFFRPDKIHFERLVNPTAVIHGPHGYLTKMFEHYNFSKGVTEWVSKHNQYSELEAMEGIKLTKAGFDLKAIMQSDRASRRKALKNLSFFLPCRAFLRFFEMYFVRRGILDGIPGYHYCRLIAFYEYLISLKMKEILLKEKGLSL
jgi:hypothetical protein